MTVARQNTGRAAEELAAARLRSAGWRIVERNARTRYGEIDIVALVGRGLVFVEVKAGQAGARSGPERPVLAVGREKQRRLRRLAAAWLVRGGPVPRHAELRFDVVGVLYGRDGGLLDVEHIRAAF